MTSCPDKLIYKNTQESITSFTSHGVGFKKILCKELPETLLIKQIAVGYLKPGDEISSHVHPDLDEYYYVLEGNGSIFLNGNMLPFHEAIFVKVPAGAIHSLVCEQDLTFFYFGVEIISKAAS